MYDPLTLAELLRAALLFLFVITAYFGCMVGSSGLFLKSAAAWIVFGTLILATGTTFFMYGICVRAALGYVIPAAICMLGSFLPFRQARRMIDAQATTPAPVTVKQQ